MRRLIFTPSARADFRAAYRWYETQRTGLGQQFRTSVEATTTRLLRNPERFRVALDQFRRVLLRRFPFEIFYEFDAERVVVHLIFHTSQDAETWRRRLRHD
jgi:toxin ParE1/3/4